MFAHLHLVVDHVRVGGERFELSLTQVAQAVAAKTCSFSKTFCFLILFGPKGWVFDAISRCGSKSKTIMRYRYNLFVVRAQQSGKCQGRGFESCKGHFFTSFRAFKNALWRGFLVLSHNGVCRGWLGMLKRGGFRPSAFQKKWFQSGAGWGKKKIFFWSEKFFTDLVPEKNFIFCAVQRGRDRHFKRHQKWF